MITASQLQPGQIFKTVHTNRHAWEYAGTTVLPKTEFRKNEREVVKAKKVVFQKKNLNRFSEIILKIKPGIETTGIGTDEQVFIIITELKKNEIG